MAYDPEIHHRRSVRLPGYDYAQAGGYFLTICTYAREQLFGEVIDDVMRLSEYGALAEATWLQVAEIRKEVALDAFVVMPNHVHGIVLFSGSDHTLDDGTGQSMPPSSSKLQSRRVGTSGYPRSLGRFVAGYKGAVTTAINTRRNTPGITIWQRNYHEHVIRNEDDMTRIRAYIADNPARWTTDPENIVLHSSHL